MKKLLMKALSYLLITFFIYFLLHLIRPYFPGLADSLNKFSEKILNSINLNMNPQVFSIILSLILFVILYAIIVKVAGTIRKKSDLVPDNIDPHTRYSSIIYSIFKIIIIIISIPLIYGFARTFAALFKEFSFENNNLFFFLLGFAAFTVFWLIFWKRFGFFSIFEHELTHMIVAMCFFHPPRAFYVEKGKGGWVRLAGINFLITLAPYFLLTLCFLMLPIYLIIKPEFSIYYFLIMGIFTSYHTLSTIRETNFYYQPDLIFNGKIFSLVIIVLGNLFCYGYILSFVLGGFEKGRNFITSSWSEALSLLKSTIF